MYRRSLIGTLGLVLGAGCLSGGTNGSESTPTPSPTASLTPTPESVEITAETLYSDTNYPVELEAGSEVFVEVDVRKGGPVMVLIHHKESGDRVLEERVDTQEKLSTKIETTGLYRIYVLNNDETDLRIYYEKNPN